MKFYWTIVTLILFTAICYALIFKLFGKRELKKSLIFLGVFLLPSVAGHLFGKIAENCIVILYLIVGISIYIARRRSSKG